MKRFSVHDREAISAAHTALERGGVVLFPTDTLYGLAVDPRNASAVKRLVALKGRSEQKGISIIVPDMETLFTCIQETQSARALADQFLPGGLTIVGKAMYPFPEPIVMSENGTIGVRIPDHAFCSTLAQTSGIPFTATSANKSGLQTQKTIAGVCAQFGDRAELIDVAIDGGTLEGGVPSTVVDVSVEPPRILREGALSKEEIASVCSVEAQEKAR